MGIFHIYGRRSSCTVHGTTSVEMSKGLLLLRKLSSFAGTQNETANKLMDFTRVLIALHSDELVSSPFTGVHFTSTQYSGILTEDSSSSLDIDGSVSLRPIVGNFNHRTLNLV